MNLTLSLFNQSFNIVEISREDVMRVQGSLRVEIFRFRYRFEVKDSLKGGKPKPSSSTFTFTFTIHNSQFTIHNFICRKLVKGGYRTNPMNHRLGIRRIRFDCLKNAG